MAKKKLSTHKKLSTRKNIAKSLRKAKGKAKSLRKAKGAAKKITKKAVKKAKKLSTHKKLSTRKNIAKSFRKAKGKAKSLRKAQGKSIGTVTHYFPHVQAAVIKLTAPLAIGDTVKIKGHTTDLAQMVTSMQIDRVAITSAKKSDEIGLQVSSRVRQGDKVYKG